MTRPSLVIEAFVALCLVIIASGCVVCGYWMMWPYEVLTVYPAGTQTPMRVNAKQYHAGERVFWRYYVEHHTDGVHVEERRELIDGTVTQYAPTSSFTQVGLDVHQTYVKLPDYTPPGWYHVKVVMTFHINPLRDIVVSRSTENFQVVP